MRGEGHGSRYVSRPASTGSQRTINATPTQNRASGSDSEKGPVLVVVAVLMIADYMPILTGFLQRFTPAALKTRL